MIPDHLRESVAAASRKLDWPDWETRFGGCSAVTVTSGTTQTVVPIQKARAVPVGECDHSKHRRWGHDDTRFRCGGCKKTYPKNPAAETIGLVPRRGVGRTTESLHRCAVIANCKICGATFNQKLPSHTVCESAHCKAENKRLSGIAERQRAMEKRATCKHERGWRRKSVRQEECRDCRATRSSLRAAE